jgi:mannose-6-phosphate isomerase-like protein (cupin superfamily)
VDSKAGTIINLDDLDHTEHAHEFVGAEHGDVPFSVILVHSQPGVGPKLHRHPYPEVFVVESGQATFQIGDRTIAIDGGHVVVSPPGEAHGFTNTGSGELRLTAIHGAGRFDTEWRGPGYMDLETGSDRYASLAGDRPRSHRVADLILSAMAFHA